MHVYAYQLRGKQGPLDERRYELVTDSAELLQLEQPFAIKLPIAQIAP